MTKARLSVWSGVTRHGDTLRHKGHQGHKDRKAPGHWSATSCAGSIAKLGIFDGPERHPHGGMFAKRRQTGAGTRLGRRYPVRTLLFAAVVVSGAALYFMSPAERRKLTKAAADRIAQAIGELRAGPEGREPFYELILTRTRWPIVTPLLIGITMWVFARMTLSSTSSSASETLIAWGANYMPSTTTGEWWRLTALTLVHGSLFQLLATIAALLSLGLVLERLVGRIAFATVYVSAGIVAGVVTLWARPATKVTAGASGAILGLYGLLVVVAVYGYLRQPRLPASLLAMKRIAAGAVVFVAALLFTDGLGMAGNFAGLMTGMVAGLRHRPRRHGAQGGCAPFGDRHGRRDRARSGHRRPAAARARSTPAPHYARMRGGGIDDRVGIREGGRCVHARPVIVEGARAGDSTQHHSGAAGGSRPHRRAPRRSTRAGAARRGRPPVPRFARGIVAAARRRAGRLKHEDAAGRRPGRAVGARCARRGSAEHGKLTAQAYPCRSACCGSMRVTRWTGTQAATRRRREHQRRRWRRRPAGSAEVMRQNMRVEGAAQAEAAQRRRARGRSRSAAATAPSSIADHVARAWRPGPCGCRTRSCAG